MTLLRGIAALVGVLILAAVAHVTTMATGGYADTNAAITIALACGVAIGAPVAGICIERGQRMLAMLAALALLAGELYSFGATASWHVAHLEAQAAPIHEAEARHADAKAWVARLERDDRVERAERALSDAQADARAKSTAPDCGKGCIATLGKSVDAATAAGGGCEAERRQARAALDKVSRWRDRHACAAAVSWRQNFQLSLKFKAPRTMFSWMSVKRALRKTSGVVVIPAFWFPFAVTTGADPRST
jgi:hypothetical protein